MALIRIEMFRDGAWKLRAEGQMNMTDEQVRDALHAYCVQYPHRAFVDGVMVGECQPKKGSR
jgi:sRNA-binding protein